MFWAEQMLRRSSTMGFMVDACQKFHTTIGVFSLPDVGVHHAREALMDLKTAS